MGLGVVEEDRVAVAVELALEVGAGALSTLPAAKQAVPATAVRAGLGVGVADGVCDALVVAAGSITASAAAEQPETEAVRAAAVRRVAKRKRLVLAAR